MATIKGTIDNDLLSGTGLADFFYGDAGDDTMTGGAGDDTMYGEAGNDTLSGGSGNDTLDGGEGADIINGNSGDDTIIAGNGDIVNGGSGYDTIDFSVVDSGVTADLGKRTFTWGENSQSAQSIEKFLGSAYNDFVKGGSSANTLIGGDGNDTLRGAAGADTLSGGDGVDTYVFAVKDVVANGVHLGVDFVTDFSTSDRIDLKSFFNGQTVDNYNDVIQINYDGTNTTVSVQTSGAFVDVVSFAGDFSAPAQSWVEDKIILV